MITVHFQPDGGARSIEKAPTVMHLLKQLGLKRTEALVVRDGQLLTYDLALKPGDEVIVRRVVSRG